MGNWLYFTNEEVEGLDNELVSRLDQARHLAKIPFVITDGLRTPYTNTDPNAVKDSAHLKGLAVDLRCRDSGSLFLMKRALYSAGFNRIGIYFRVDPKDSTRLHPTHLHVDIDPDKPQDREWSTVEL